MNFLFWYIPLLTLKHMFLCESCQTTIYSVVFFAHIPHIIKLRLEIFVKVKQASYFRKVIMENNSSQTASLTERRAKLRKKIIIRVQPTETTRRTPNPKVGSTKSNSKYKCCCFKKLSGDRENEGKDKSTKMRFD